MDPVTSDLLQDLVVTAITGKTGAADRVYSPRTWPTKVDGGPIILVQSPKEHWQGMGRSGGPQFTSIITMRVIGRLTGAAAAGDPGAQAVLAAVGVLARQIAVAVINDYALKRVVQAFASVDVVNGVSTEGERPVGEVVMEFGLEVYMGPEDFAPTVCSPIEQLAVYADLVNVFSPTGVFNGTPFAAAAAPPPRTSGPDGRAEGASLTDLPQ